MVQCLDDGEAMNRKDAREQFMFLGPEKENLGDALRRARQERGLSLAEAVSRCLIEGDTLARIEKGNAFPGWGPFFRLQQLLLDGVEDPEAKSVSDEKTERLMATVLRVLG